MYAYEKERKKNFLAMKLDLYHYESLPQKKSTHSHSHKNKNDHHWITSNVFPLGIKLDMYEV